MITVMFSKWLARGLATLAVLLSPMGQWSAAQQTHIVEVQLLAINDFHGNLEPPTGTDGQVNHVPAGGAEYLATHLRNAVRENPNSILVAAGDLMGASPLISGLFHDSPTIEAMNAMNLAVTSVGNHEFDPGAGELLHRLEGGCLQQQGCREDEKSPAAHFQYLAANVLRENALGENREMLPATAVRTVGGVKIGFIGETLQGTDRGLSAPAAKGLSFLEESRVANEAAARLEKEGVHAIVLLIHQGGQQRVGQGGDGDPNGCVNFGGGIAAIASKLSPAIKVVVSGHTHQFYNCTIDGHTVTSAGSYGRLFTRITLSIDAASDTIVSVSAKNEVVTRDVAKDPAQTAILGKYRHAEERIANRIVGSVTAAITRTRGPSGESALGELIADAQLASVSSPDKGGAEVAFMNSGGIRTNISIAADHAGPVKVTYGDLYSVQPFGNRVLVFTMTGDMIRRLLEQQFDGRGGGQILQVSEGFTYKYKSQAPAGEHVTPGSIAIHGHPVAPADRVRVAASDFLQDGGDGFTVFREASDIKAGPLDIDALVAYVTAHSPVAPGPLNRVVRVE